MPNYGFSKVNVMIADDQYSMRRILHTVLEEFGVREIFGVRDGGEAIKAMETFKPDILFSDFHMQPMDGLSLVEEVRFGRTGCSPYLPIIMVSSYTELHHIQRARDLGVTEFLGKPVSARAIMARLKTVVEKPRPFVKNQTFFGPDRRRRNLEDVPKHMERRNRPHGYAEGAATPRAADRHGP